MCIYRIIIIIIIIIININIRETENSVSTIEFYRLFLTKSNGLLRYMLEIEKKMTIYICPHFFYKNLLFSITNILLIFL